MRPTTDLDAARAAILPAGTFCPLAPAIVRADLKGKHGAVGRVGSPVAGLVQL
jgi:hypothetical protein